MAAAKFWFPPVRNDPRRPRRGRASRRAWAAVLVAALCPLAHADLARQLSAWQSFAADFEQTVIGAGSQVLQRSEGAARLARPDRFKWVVADPYPQTLVTVGDKLYLYDPDLEQLTVEPLTDAIAGSPALLLLQGEMALDRDYEVVESRFEDRVEYLLLPKAEDALFAEVRLRFQGTALTRLDIRDHLGQLTEVVFSNVQLDAAIGADEFAFEVPEGTDVLGEL